MTVARCPAILLMAWLRAHRFHNTDEAELQLAIAAILTDHGVYFRREVPFGLRDRIDFMVEDGLGVEIKIKGAFSEVARQLSRYALHPEITELLLVTTRLQLDRFPDTIGGKRLSVLSLPRGLR